MSTKKTETPVSFHMSTEDFRKQGFAMIDWIADYWKGVESMPVLSQSKPGDLRKSLPPAPPEQGESFDEMMRDVEQHILPGITHWQSPNFFAFFPCNASGPSVLGELLSAGFGVQGMIWATSPACTELETHVLDWVAEMLGLPEQFKSSGKGGGVIQDSASSASLTALLASRERSSKFSGNTQGCDNNLTVYTSSQAHSSIEKAVRISGIGSDNLRLIDVDENFAMDIEDLTRNVEADIQTGKRPCFVAATIGTTSSNAMDSLSEIGELCRKHDIWLHIDGAMSGTAAVCPEFRHLLDGVELADSFCFNPHKWMFTNFDCDCFFVADRGVLIRTLSILPEYLRNQATESGAVIDYRDWQIPLGRRFRALKLWFVIRHYGVQGLQHHIRKHVELAQQFAAWIEADDQFELMAPAPLNLVCFRHIGGDEFNKELLDTLNQSGKLYLTHTKLHDKFTLRMSIGQTNTEFRHVEQAWQRIRKTAGMIKNRK
ncbi:MAG: L-2,4-diaminobutyrate decarboxylase [Deltaproteobacteria bacterium]|nr:L-2,4-diaminobutyrate decarboxylase [Deltaproteobacteria bacterium]